MAGAQPSAGHGPRTPSAHQGTLRAANPASEALGARSRQALAEIRTLSEACSREARTTAFARALAAEHHAKPARILIADDHEVVRLGVRTLLEGQQGWLVCGEATTGREAVAKAVELRPDVVVLDISMPDLNGLEATRQVRRVVPAKILILSVHESDYVAAEVRNAGANGYVLKRSAGLTLVEAVAALLDDREFFTERVRAACESPGGPTNPPWVDAATDVSNRLTPRQREVLQLLGEGKTNKEVGAALGMSTKTAETHRTHIMAKLGLHSISHLVRYAIRNYIIEP
jgi:DNA-binding NarL/FixJ family response regulator